MTYNEKLVKLVKAVGQEIIDRAEDLVGNGDCIDGFDINLHFPDEKLDEIPTITVTREHMSTRSCDLFFDDFRGE